ncbi:hypothetical protein AAG906_037495 [Vitis piasezkii]
MGGGMEAHKNKFIEDWGAARENLEYNFRSHFSVLLSNFKRNFLSGFSFPLRFFEGKENAEISLRKLSNLNDVVVSDD